MQKSYRFLMLLGFIGLALSVTLFSACNKDDDDADSDLVVLEAFGPSPALRGGELRIIGQNLDQVLAVVLPENIEVTDFTSQASNLITLTIPEETVEGKIRLKAPDGDITSLTILTISEPITIASFSPEVARPGDVITIEGDYLNLITSIFFSEEQEVLAENFVSQEKTKIEVEVPAAAQSGSIVLSSVQSDSPMPILVETETPLEVTTPSGTDLAPNPVKAGTILTISGSDLDLVQQVIFVGADPVLEFVSQSASSMEIVVPATAQDGPVKLVPASNLQISVDVEVEMLLPTVSSISPNPVKNGETITITGSDLDLITNVSFGGAVEGSIQAGGNDTEIVVDVPLTATEDLVTFTTTASKTFTSDALLSLVKPEVSSISPLPAQFGQEITITGTNLDLVAAVLFAGDVSQDVNMATTDMLTVTVPIGALSGPVAMVMHNGEAEASAIDFEVALSTNAVITDIPSLVSIGELISIVGENLDELNEVIFPGEVPATMFGQKTATLIEVFVPEGTSTGLGNIKFITFSGEEFFSPEINIQGVDVVVDPDLVFFNFDGLDLWWGDTGGIENDPSLSLDGSNYYRANADLSGWTGFFWRNGGDNFPGATIGSNVSNYVLKFDINVLEPMTGGILHWRLKGSEGDFWYRWEPWAATGSFSTNGWITVTVPLTDFLDDFGSGTNGITDLSLITEDFGVAFNDGDSRMNVCIDNVRFEAL